MTYDTDTALDALSRAQRLALVHRWASHAQDWADKDDEPMGAYFAALASSAAAASERAALFARLVDGAMAEAAGIIVVATEGPGDVA